jgi:hypothetical protein
MWTFARASTEYASAATGGGDKAPKNLQSAQLQATNTGSSQMLPG